MTNIRAQRLLTIFICFATFGLCPSASAQSPPPDSAELIEALKPKPKTRELNLATAPAERDRVEKRKKIIDLLRKKGTRGLSVEDRTDLPEIVSDRPSVDMEVYFDYNSAAITDQAKPTLSSLGRALQAKELKGQSFLLAGHTDATGAPKYNQDLSQRRAIAVKNYLIQNFGLSESELVAMGFGEDQLKIPNDPAAAQNRRVQVINVGE
jgi:outer membrane protein OmpA-like peptidoglycan-associated protein